MNRLPFELLSCDVSTATFLPFFCTFFHSSGVYGLLYRDVAETNRFDKSITSLPKYFLKYVGNETNLKKKLRW